MRGTSHRHTMQYRSCGITPACAGNIKQKARAASPDWDHPRLCGEHKITYDGCDIDKGSPPPVRGTSAQPNYPRVSCRITPACAGNMCRAKMRGKDVRDHPRLCGEHPASYPSFGGSPGSPPPVRGTYKNGVEIYEGDRITPACAGNMPLQRHATV